MKHQYIGNNIDRPDGPRKVNGEAVYLDDIRLPGLLHLAVLLPDYAHAKIIAIDTREAERSPGVVRVVTGRDCPFRYGIDFRDRYPLALNRVRHAGEPVAAVIAETTRRAREATRKIRVEYEPLPVYTDGREAMAEDAVLIHPESGKFEPSPRYHPIGGTNIADHRLIESGNITEGFHSSSAVAEGEFSYPFSVPGALEPHGAIVWFRTDGTIEAWIPSIRPFMVREKLAEIFHRPICDVRVHIPEVGGCFGDKSGSSLVFTVAAAASLVPGRPVKWFATRKESFLSTSIGNGVRTRMKIGADAAGKLTALEATVYHSVGGAADIGAGVEIAAVENILGPYDIPHYRLEGYSVYTNTPPIGALRGFGSQLAFFATERLMDILADKLEMDPRELRRKNYVRPGGKAAGGGRYPEDLGDITRCADLVSDRLFSRPKPAEDMDYFYGRGFAAVRKTPGSTPFFGKGCYLKFNGDGSVTINLGGVDMGGGHRNAMRQIAAEALLISPERIRVNSGIDTQFSPWEWQTVASLSVLLGGRAVLEASAKAIDQLKETAARILDCDTEQLDYDGEDLFKTADPSLRVSVDRLVHGYRDEQGRTIGGEIQSTATVRLPDRFRPSPTDQRQVESIYIFGAQGCELRIEKKTGRVIIDHFISAFDVGQVISPRQIRGQVTGGVIMALGAALGEELKFDRDGKPLNPSFGGYHLPKFRDAPRVQTVEFVETPSDFGPFGARPIGEGTVVGVAPAVLNGIADAIGVQFFDLPVTPRGIRAALNNARHK